MGKNNAKGRSTAPNFGPALAKARQDADHIFKQANEDSLNLAAAVAAEEEEAAAAAAASGGAPASQESSGKSNDPRSKAAAWAWYQRNSSSSNGSSSPENVRNRALVVLKRSSRFKAEALRINGSCTAEDTLAASSSRWDPSRSLFDSYELLSVAKELDKALKEPQPVAAAAPVAPAAAPPPPAPPKLSSSRSLDSHSSLRRLSKFIPAPVLCLSEEDVASSSPKRKSELSNRRKPRNDAGLLKPQASKLSVKLSKAIQLFTYTPPADCKSGSLVDLQEYHHQHFHHHHHHHHHVVDELSL